MTNVSGTMYLLIESDLLNIGQHFSGQIGLASANWCGSPKGHVVIKAVAESAPGVELAFQAPDHATQPSS